MSRDRLTVVVNNGRPVKKPQLLREVLNEPLDEWQVPGLLPRSCVSVLFGDANCGKTFLALDMAARIAIGGDWCGKPIKAAPVLYVAAEGGGGMRKRWRALLRAHPGLLTAPFYLLRQAINIRTNHAELFEQSKLIAQEHDQLLGLIVIDTLAQTLFGDENSGEDMSAYIAACNELAARTGAPVLILHHMGKDNMRGARGHSSLRGNVDVMIRVKVQDGIRIATTDAAEGGKTRDDEPTTFAFRLHQVDVGKTPAGDPATSCIVLYENAPPTKPARARSPRGDKQMLLYGLTGEMMKASTDFGKGGAPAGRPCIKMAAAQERWRAAVPGQSGEPRHFRRTITPMIENGLLATDGEWLWTP